MRTHTADPLLPRKTTGQCELRLLSPAHGAALPLRVYRGPPSRPHPALVYLHGGHFTNGSQDDAAALAHAVTDTATVITVGYPLAPESVFPHTLEACFPILAWVAEHARSLGVDPKRLFIGGEQAGGALAAALAMIARDRLFDRPKSRRLAGQILIAPLLDPEQATPSLREAAEHPSRQGWASYLVRPADFHHPYASPLRSRRLAGLPPCLLVTGRKDPLRDEAQMYGSRLRAAGVKVRLHHGASAGDAESASLAQPHVDLLKTFLKENAGV